MRSWEGCFDKWTVPRRDEQGQELLAKMVAWEQTAEREDQLLGMGRTSLSITSRANSKRGLYVAFLLQTIIPFSPSVLWAQLIARDHSWRFCGLLCGAWVIYLASAFFPDVFTIPQHGHLICPYQVPY